MMSRRSSFATCSVFRCRLAFRASLVFFQVYCHVAVIFRLGVQSFRGALSEHGARQKRHRVITSQSCNSIFLTRMVSILRVIV